LSLPRDLPGHELRTAAPLAAIHKEEMSKNPPDASDRTINFGVSGMAAGLYIAAPSNGHNAPYPQTITIIFV
tara:strand:+ start:234 stop:449 length:216 start_codon:yes stop_codon:yes gene_type:complete